MTLGTAARLMLGFADANDAGRSYAPGTRSASAVAMRNFVAARKNRKLVSTLRVGEVCPA